MYKKVAKFSLIVLLLILLDQLTKAIADTALADVSSVVLINDFLSFQLVYNRGAAFGMLDGGRILFIIITVFICLFLELFYIRIPDTKRYIPLKICCIGIFAGAVGNFIDRVKQGYVVDFIACDFGSYSFPRFNIADIYISVTGILLIFLLIFYYKDDEITSVFKKEENK